MPAVHDGGLTIGSVNGVTCGATTAETGCRLKDWPAGVSLLQ